MQRQAADESATAKAAFYQRSLQEVTLFKSRMNAALIQIEERLARDTAEAEDAERRYARTYADAESSMTSGRNLLARLQAVRLDSFCACCYCSWLRLLGLKSYYDFRVLEGVHGDDVCV